MNKKEAITNIVYFFKTWLNMLLFMFFSMIKSFGFKFPIKKIPHGMYCYVSDTPKNKKKKDSMYNEGSTYYIKPCFYYRHLPYNLRGCMFKCSISDDFMFKDQIKICDKNCV
jgi:hypothetical protein